MLTMELLLLSCLFLLPSPIPSTGSYCYIFYLFDFMNRDSNALIVKSNKVKSTTGSSTRSKVSISSIEISVAVVKFRKYKKSQ
ncbi:hypothetical protein CLU79DRAFT_770345 [Phycomyces nitens]|nr:hypothetical protein CLU79DRAFT_770345 [Phycomyces nitens]